MDHMNMSGGEVVDWVDDHKTELLLAVYEGNLARIQYLLDVEGVHVDSSDDDDVTAVQIAAFMGNNMLVSYLLDRGADLESTSQVGMTPFLHACREGKLSVIDTLLQRGADIHKCSGLGANALTLAAAGAHMDVVKKLVSLGVGTSQPTSHGICPTPLIAAAFRNSPQICGFLILRKAAAVDETMDSLLGLSALSCTVMCSTTTVVFSALLDLGAEPRKRTLKNKTAYELARMRNRQEFEIILNSKMRKRYDVNFIDVRQFILEECTGSAGLKARKDDVLPDGSTPIFFATSIGNSTMVSELLNMSVQTHIAEPKYGLLPIQISSMLQLDTITTMLLPLSNICYTNNQQMTCFDYYISTLNDHDAGMRAKIHCFKPQKLEAKFNLSSSSNSFTKALLSKVASQFSNEKSSEQSSISMTDWRDARLHLMPVEGRNNKKLILTEQLLHRTKALSPKRTNTLDTVMEVIRNLAAEAQTFEVNCFYDYYVGNGEEGDDEANTEKQKSHYDSALMFSSLYGYQPKPSIIVPSSSSASSIRNYPIVIHKRDISDPSSSLGRKTRTLSLYEVPSTNQSRTTPRMLKKTRDQTSNDDSTNKIISNYHIRAPRAQPSRPNVHDMPRYTS
ncbi:unnamed protein product [Auanema sp. JU1783]|nr:unnamed protein product [Auanema sp. JU1783]